MDLDLLLVFGYVLSVEKFVNGRVLGEPLVRGGAAVHEDTAYYVQRGVYRGGLFDVKQKVGILEDVHPETQRQTVVLPRVNVRLCRGGIKCFVEDVDSIYYLESLCEYFNISVLLFCKDVNYLLIFL